MTRVLWMAAVLAACSDDDPRGRPPDAAPSAAEMALGSSTADRMSFLAVEDGSDLPLVRGSQGGFHVWTGVRLRGASGILHLDREARRLSDDKLVFRASTVVLEVPPAEASTWWETPLGDEREPFPSFMCPTLIGIGIRDEPLILRAWLLTRDDELLAEDDLTFVPRCPPGDEEFCAEICSG